MNEKEEKIIELLEQSHLSFKELHDKGGILLRSESTLNRILKSLQRMNYIESFPVEDPNTRIKKRYHLTKKYYDDKEERGKNLQLSKMIKTRLNWQNVFDKMINFLELEYPIFFQNPEQLNVKEIYSDIFSYLIFFKIDYDTLGKNSKLYFELMLYLIIHHPDNKYRSIQKEFDFNIEDFREFFIEFKNEKKLETFVKQESTSSIKEFYYLISDDPILYFIRQQVETIFFKFLLCWQFPGVFLEDNFDLIFNYSHQILNNLFNKFESESNEYVMSFIKKNRICLLTYTREYIFEFLDKIKMETQIQDTEYPLELLPREQKEEYITELILSPEILTRVENKYIEKHLEFLGLNFEKVQKLEELLKGLLLKIEDISNIELKSEELLFLKSRLLTLVRIFYHSNKDLYKKFKKNYNSSGPLIEISYSKISDDIFNGVIEILLNLDTKREDIKKKFTIRQLLERIDHISNKIQKSPDEKEKFNLAIMEIFKVASINFSEKSQYPFFKKKCQLFFEDIKLFDEAEIITIIKKLKKDYPRNTEVLKLILKYLSKSRNHKVVNEIIKDNSWSSLDKIKIFEGFVFDVPVKLNLVELFNLSPGSLQDMLKTTMEKNSNMLQKLLKSVAFILEERGSIIDAFFIYYLASILEQNIEFDPSKRGYIHSYLSMPDFNVNRFRLYGPAYLNLMRMDQQYAELLFENPGFREEITLIIISNFYAIEPNELMDKYIKNFSSLLDVFSLIANYFDLESDFQNLVHAIKTKKEIKISIVRKGDIKTIMDVTKKEKQNLLVIINKLKEFNSNTKTLDYVATAFSIDNFLREKEKKIKQFIPSNIGYIDPFSKFMSVQREYGIDEFPDLARANIFKFASSNSPFIYNNPTVKEYDLMHYNLYNFNRNLMGEQQKPEFDLIEKIFSSNRDSNDYPFKLAFERRYDIPENKELTFWRDGIKDLKHDEDQLIEILDLYFFHSRFFISFDFLKDLVLLILRKYDVNASINYINIFSNYISWYYKRIINPREEVIPYALGQDFIFQLFDFGFNTLKAEVFWEYRDRNEAQNYVNLASQALVEIKKQSLKLFGLSFLEELEENLAKLKTELMV